MKRRGRKLQRRYGRSRGLASTRGLTLPDYRPHVGRSSAQSAADYAAYARDHREIGEGYLRDAAKRASLPTVAGGGAGDRLVKNWRKIAKRHFELAQRADHEVMRHGGES